MYDQAGNCEGGRESYVIYHTALSFQRIHHLEDEHVTAHQPLNVNIVAIAPKLRDIEVPRPSSRCGAQTQKLTPVNCLF